MKKENAKFNLISNSVINPLPGVYIFRFKKIKKNFKFQKLIELI